MAENVDAQLKRMSQDLKEIIEHLNTSNGLADTSDPVRILCTPYCYTVQEEAVLTTREREVFIKLIGY